MLDRLDPILATPITLTDVEFADLLAFVRDGLLDPRAVPDSLCRILPTRGAERHGRRDLPGLPALATTLSMPFRHFLEVRMRVAANSLKLGAVLVVSTTALAAAVQHLAAGWKAPWEFLDGTAEIDPGECLPLPRRHRRGPRPRRRRRRDRGPSLQRTPASTARRARAAVHERGRPIRGPRRRPCCLSWPRRKCAGGPTWPISPGPRGHPTDGPTCSSAGGQGEASRFFLNRGRDGLGELPGLPGRRVADRQQPDHEHHPLLQRAHGGLQRRRSHRPGRLPVQAEPRPLHGAVCRQLLRPDRASSSTTTAC